MEDERAEELSTLQSIYPELVISDSDPTLPLLNCSWRLPSLCLLPSSHSKMSNDFRIYPHYVSKLSYPPSIPNKHRP